MITRRRLLQLLAAMPGLGASVLSRADTKGARVALVIGNAAYPDSPLLNPVNDAKAVARLFEEAGMGVDLRTDTTRNDMVDAVARLTSLAQDPAVRQVYFYYAGHGVQLAWRNYLLPIDARIKSSDQVRERCIDLGAILARLGGSPNRVHVVIVDACRDDPFGASYRPEQRGLSQFDAPPGTLLAYATAPGKAASDGAGSNSLYTESLVRELSIRKTRIEDALKRVRLNVRLISKDEQVPWESTSLETDVFLFDDGPPKRSEEEVERELEFELAAWERIKDSRSSEDWAAHLRRFPNGHFAQLAQKRLARLLQGGAPAAAAARPPAPQYPIVHSDRDHEALAAGTVYLDPEGILRRKSR